MKVVVVNGEGHRDIGMMALGFFYAEHSSFLTTCQVISASFTIVKFNSGYLAVKFRDLCLSKGLIASLFASEKFEELSKRAMR